MFDQASFRRIVGELHLGWLASIFYDSNETAPDQYFPQEAEKLSSALAEFQPAGRLLWMFFWMERAILECQAGQTECELAEKDKKCRAEDKKRNRSLEFRDACEARRVVKLQPFVENHENFVNTVARDFYKHVGKQTER